MSKQHNNTDKSVLRKRVKNDYTYHPPFGTQVERYGKIRKAHEDLALLLVELCPLSRELSSALTNLEQCCAYANGAIARNEKPEESVEESSV